MVVYLWYLMMVVPKMYLHFYLSFAVMNPLSNFITLGYLSAVAFKINNFS